MHLCFVFFCYDLVLHACLVSLCQSRQRKHVSRNFVRNHQSVSFIRLCLSLKRFLSVCSFFHLLVTSSSVSHAFCPSLTPSITQSPTRAVLLKMAVQRGGGSPRPGSACVLKRSPLVEAELCEARSSSACSYPAPLPNKLAGKVNQRGNKRLSWCQQSCC